MEFKTNKDVEQNRQEALRLALECPVAAPEEIEEYNEFGRQFRWRARIFHTGADQTA